MDNDKSTTTPISRGLPQIPQTTANIDPRLQQNFQNYMTLQQARYSVLQRQQQQSSANTSSFPPRTTTAAPSMNAAPRLPVSSTAPPMQALAGIPNLSMTLSNQPNIPSNYMWPLRPVSSQMPYNVDLFKMCVDALTRQQELNCAERARYEMRAAENMERLFSDATDKYTKMIMEKEVKMENMNLEYNTELLKREMDRREDIIKKMSDHKFELLQKEEEKCVEIKKMNEDNKNFMKMMLEQSNERFEKILDRLPLISSKVQSSAATARPPINSPPRAHDYSDDDDEDDDGYPPSSGPSSSLSRKRSHSPLGKEIKKDGIVVGHVVTVHSTNTRLANKYRCVECKTDLSNQELLQNHFSRKHSHIEAMAKKRKSKRA
ncbi:unnamed protein product [Caenorhabditis sp. 36 PRJEB53466]|nr:unnamed protein product [Caenorhabditis sp. 36 PRJEB53466]